MKQKTGIPTKSFKRKFGFGVLNKYNRIISNSHKWVLCPKCNKKKLTRQSLGLWVCKKCKHEVLGNAYKIN